MLRLPRPHGPYAIGTRTYHWVDENRPDRFATKPDAWRELMVQIWYPALPQPDAPPVSYVEDSLILTPLADLIHLPPSTFAFVQDITTNAVRDAPAAGVDTEFPVLIFLHGRCGFRGQNTVLAEHLVSHGYVVAAIDQPFAASGVIFPDGRHAPFDPRMKDRRFVDDVVPLLAEDVVFALDRLETLDEFDVSEVLTRRLDLERIGVSGVSLGGMVGPEACRIEPKLHACLAIDAPMPASVVDAGLDQPTMWISRDPETMRREGWSQADVDGLPSTMRAVYDHLRKDGYIVSVPGMFHMDFSDFPLWVQGAPALLRGFMGSIDGRRGLEIVNAYALAFFDRHLKGLPAPLLDGPSKRYKEVVFEKHGPVKPS